jgi:hypothetical protein
MEKELKQALIEFLKAEFGFRIPPYDCSFEASEKYEKLMAILGG